jgi:hypothetical protein
MRPFNHFVWILLPVVAAAQSCQKPQPVPYVPFSVNYDVTTLVDQPGFDSVPHLSTGFVALNEASGAVYCSWAPHAVWVIEDGGVGPILYLVDVRNGRVMSRVQLTTGWTNEDWEDLAHWTDASGQHWLGIGEIGDNDGVYLERRIYGMPEPVGIDTAGSTIQTHQPPVTKVWTYVYPDGPRDAESLFVDPMDGQMYLVSKRDFRNRVYVLPADPAFELDTAKYLGDLPLFMTTAADRLQLPDGRSPIVVRSYGRLYYWDAAPNEAACDVLQRVPTQLPYTDQEAQGEIFAWLPDGSYVLLSEKVGGVAPQVHRYLKN